MIVDSSALIAIVKNEPGATRCKETLIAASSVRLPAANLVEAYLVVDRSLNPNASDEFERLLNEAAIAIESVTEAQARLARSGYQRYGKGRHPAGLNYGDCFAYALARETGEPLLFVGNDFSQTDIGIA